MRPLLVVFDLNGTLLQRLARSNEKTLARQNRFLPEEPDFGVRKSKVYLRPYTDTLFAQLGAMPDVSFGVWTSAQPENARPLARAALGAVFGSQAFVLDRTHCKNAPMGVASSKVVKDLSVIWNSPIFNPGGRWSETNTIIIDDSPGKSRKNPFNALFIPEFTYLTPTSRFSDPAKDIALFSLLMWLRRLEASGFDDIREIVRTSPIYQISGNGSVLPNPQFLPAANSSAFAELSPANHSRRTDRTGPPPGSPSTPEAFAHTDSLRDAEYPQDRRHDVSSRPAPAADQASGYASSAALTAVQEPNNNRKSKKLGKSAARRSGNWMADSLETETDNAGGAGPSKKALQ
ncbi:hypothetical protein HK105_206129 [Polyrhizophydium stewartii]|uniref:Mitochondrial import inner membrane translocase subunit TIM50 n=1 Tax=Polyrhizophydium stewartii TaxID=2732419 RepID=A0ABR4N4A4_9FUNG